MMPPPNLAELLETRVYPGMIEPESRVLRAFLAKHGAEYDEILFDQRLGPGVELPAHVPEQDRRDWERRTKARPDCIAMKLPSDATIIEVKEQATLEGVWQVLTYAELYAVQFPANRVRVALVAAAATPAARTAAQMRGVDMYLYTMKAAAPLEPGQEQPAP